MSTFINVGVYSDNKRVATKTALKRMVRENPELLRFDQTSAFANHHPLILTIEYLLSLSKQVTFSVVGPDPFSDRKWYANVYVWRGKVVAK